MKQFIYFGIAIVVVLIGAAWYLLDQLEQMYREKKKHHIS